VQAYRLLAHALTSGRPAIAAAMQREQQILKHHYRRPSSSKSPTTTRTNTTTSRLSVDTVRLLEIRPWHPHLSSQIHDTDDVYEWQQYDPVQQVWKGDLSSLPTVFQALPVTSSPHGDDDDDDAHETHDDDGQENDEDSMASSCPSEDTTIRTDDGDELSLDMHVNDENYGGIDADDCHDQESDKGDDKGTKQLEATPSTKATSAIVVSKWTSSSSRRRKTLSLTATSMIYGLSSRVATTTSKAATILFDAQKGRGVLTNANLTLRYVFHACTSGGFPLPNPNTSGTWRWTCPWKVDKACVYTKQRQSAEADDCGNQQQQQDNGRHSNASTVAARILLPYDDDGWTYAEEAAHFVVWNAHELCWGNLPDCSCEISSSSSSSSSASSSSSSEKQKATRRDEPNSSRMTTPAPSSPPLVFGGPKRDDDDNHDTPGGGPCLRCLRMGRSRLRPTVRRRKWVRHRVLVDYPLAVKSTQECLRLAADSATMALATQALEERLDETCRSLQQATLDHDETHQNNQRHVQYYQHKWEVQEERVKILRYGKFKRKIEELTCKQEDILPIIANPHLFLHLQRALRQSGAITNAMLLQGIHFFIDDHVRKRAPPPPLLPMTTTTTTTTMESRDAATPTTVAVTNTKRRTTSDKK